MSQLAILLLAAGSSSRMAPRDKLMEKVNGQPLLGLMSHRAMQTGLSSFVTIPSLSHPRAAHVGSATPIVVPDAAEGMGASIRTGIAALPETIGAVLILPADMPEIESQDLLHMAKQFSSDDPQILRACTIDGTPGHPVLFPRRYFEELLTLSGDSGARSVLKIQPVKLVTLPGMRAVTDLDTPESWAIWRANKN